VRSTTERTTPGEREPDLLASYLAELDQRGWAVEDLLNAHPELSDSLRSALRAAARVRQAPVPVPSAEFRARARAHFAERVSADVARRTRRRGFRLSAGSILRPIAVPVAVALVLAFAFGGISTAAASALPGTPLYPAKLVVERVRILVAYTPEQQAAAHLSIAAARLQEAAAMNKSGSSAEVPALLDSFQEQVAAAEAAATRVRSPQYHEQVDREIASLEQRQRQIPPVVVASGKGQAHHANGNAADNPRPTVEVQQKPGPPVDVGGARPNDDHRTRDDTGGSATSLTATVQPAASPTGSSGAPQLADQSSEQLVRILIRQALAGDVDGATATSRVYIAAARSDASQGDGAVNRLRGQRSQLQQALVRAPATTRPILQGAIDAIDTLLAGTSRPGHDASANAGDSSGDGGGSQSSPTDSSDDHHATSGGGGGGLTGHDRESDGNGKKH
jgi:hypothetical protein